MVHPAFYHTIGVPPSSPGHHVGDGAVAQSRGWTGVQAEGGVPSVPTRVVAGEWVSILVLVGIVEVRVRECIPIDAVERCLAGLCPTGVGWNLAMIRWSWREANGGAAQESGGYQVSCLV